MSANDRQLLDLIPLADELTKGRIPYLGTIRTGYPAEAYNYIEKGVDFNELLVESKETTFTLRVVGDSMSNDHIIEGDYVIVDKLKEPQHGDMLILSINGEFTMKRLEFRGDHVVLIPSNKKYKPIVVKEGEEVQRWGVVIGIARDHKTILHHYFGTK